jgi:hypothetical protein
MNLQCVDHLIISVRHRLESTAVTDEFVTLLILIISELKNKESGA